ncbi:MAG: excinuclease ABC subunit UvrC [Dehalococcoidia bacterium]|nr:excinuclease ABC subunit UvrC [Dehalococcoidia bacterium]
MPKDLTIQLAAVPTRPGVYLMKDKGGIVLYVGKAASLRNRLGSYFGPQTGFAPKTRKLVGRVADFEVILTGSEQEALILECQLIKRYKPYYNVRLKDDKTYPYLKVTVNEDWPQVLISRRVSDDGAKYFGPYTDSGSVSRTLALIKKLFPYRSCNKTITGTDPRPCLDYHIRRCLGPCIGVVSKAEYREIIDQVVLFLEGKQDQVSSELRRQMYAAAAELAFERAAFLRDQILAVQKVVERQRIAATIKDDQDVIALHRDGADCCVQVFMIRQGRLHGNEHFILDGTLDEPNEAIIGSFLSQFYSSATSVPPLILLQCVIEELEFVQNWLKNRRGGRVEIRTPRRGEKKRMVDLVADNAHQTLIHERTKWLADSTKTAAAMLQIQEELNLPGLPRRIECYDISDIQGTSAVGSMVVFQDGKPKNSEYRRFQIKTVHGNDDYAMMKEVIGRRFGKGFAKRPMSMEDTRFIGNDERGSDGESSEIVKPATSWAAEPSLVLIDGGKGHLAAVTEVMRELGVHHIPTASIAKQREEIFLPYQSDPIMLPRDSQALYLMQRVRDEAHRFAITYHRKIRSKSATRSILDSVPGIGPQRKKALLRHFGSLKSIKEAPIEEVAVIAGMTRSVAARLKVYL